MAAAAYSAAAAAAFRLPQRSPSPLLSATRSVVFVNAVRSRKARSLVLASFSASSSFDDECFRDKDASRTKKSLLSDLVQEIEPLDVSLIQKDVPPTTIDAMKRTISGMLGLLPSNQFQILVEALWEPLSKLLISSMMTGYTLRNAEYRLCLERNLDFQEEPVERQKSDSFKLDVQGMLLDSVRRIEFPGESVVTSRSGEIAENPSEDLNIQGLGELNPETLSYIRHLQSRLSSIKKELKEAKRKNAALQMQQFVGEEKNDLLDYLRSLQPEKVAELSEPTCPEVKEAIHSVVHGLLATLSPKMHSKAPPLSDTNAAGSVNVGNEDFAELVENTSLHFQPIISLTRDHVARLLFWCMLLGHYLRGLEYRMELMELLSLPSHPDDDSA